ncbi:TetR/AcrR family transcriptional regulator [Photobacterium sanctipauli]|uniref:TetR/AcrR family transcriptional regulator n=1 Tax=Photobacterium sanctipauli TaxID=1342794 RepID=A0A2T3NYN5_9GAMM|nr:TetR/AcrR family transcriptional regulator [Photobacterium sanctipauli]PSW21385.1 TetR/AcrR family transcriptional regulator [Photobacterium sanctipauli]
MSKIEQNREKKRKAILASAQDVFLSDGYVLANMDKIAAHAQMTKQTVYRYYPSKIDLFQATLRHIGEQPDEGFLEHLNNSDPKQALTDFARDFITFHLSDEHLATYRLLVAESAKAPEILESFQSVGPNETHDRLFRFFSERLNIQEPESPIRLWTGMLLALRGEVLMGMAKPSQIQINAHVDAATQTLLAALRQD